MYTDKQGDPDMKNRKLQHLLLVRPSQEENVYGRFAGEILRSEGLASFRAVDLDAGMPVLEAGDLAVLTRCLLKVDEMDALIEQVRRGASLVCLQPPVGFAKRLGWHTTCRVMYPGWIRMKDTPWIDRAVQAHVPVTGYSPADVEGEWRVLADAVRNDGSSDCMPAAVCQRVGAGRAVLFFYDLPAAVARIRFGDPELISLLTGGAWNFPHAADLFEHQLDADVMHLPQADLHAQFLARSIGDVCNHPLARLWYYPRPDQRSAAIFQSDDDWSPPEAFDELAAALQRHNATGTFYLVQDTRVDDRRVAEMRDAGHTFGPHVNYTGRFDEVYFSYPDALAEDTALFDRRYGGHSATLQAHCAPWMGYMAWVPPHQLHGYRLLFAYLSLPPQRFNRYMCGSGRPMRFFDRDGTSHDCWQQPVILYDDSSVEERLTSNPRAALEDFQAVLNAAVQQHYTAFGVLSHPVNFYKYSRPYIEGVFSKLSGEGVPFFNGDQWLEFNDLRQAVDVDYELRDNMVRCRLTHVRGPLTVLVSDAGASRPAITLNGKPAAAASVQRFGRSHLAVELDGAERDICLDVQPVQNTKGGKTK